MQNYNYAEFILCKTFCLFIQYYSLRGDEFLNYHPIEKMGGIFVDFWERGFSEEQDIYSPVAIRFPIVLLEEARFKLIQQS